MSTLLHNTGNKSGVVTATMMIEPLSTAAAAASSEAHSSPPKKSEGTNLPVGLRESSGTRQSIVDVVSKS